MWIIDDDIFLRGLLHAANNLSKIRGERIRKKKKRIKSVKNVDFRHAAYFEEKRNSFYFVSEKHDVVKLSIEWFP